MFPPRLTPHFRQLIKCPPWPQTSVGHGNFSDHIEPAPTRGNSSEVKSTNPRRQRSSCAEPGFDPCWFGIELRPSRALPISGAGVTPVNSRRKGCCRYDLKSTRFADAAKYDSRGDRSRDRVPVGPKRRVARPKARSTLLRRSLGAACAGKLPWCASRNAMIRSRSVASTDQSRFGRSTSAALTGSSSPSQ